MNSGQRTAEQKPPALSKMSKLLLNVSCPATIRPKPIPQGHATSKKAQNISQHRGGKHFDEGLGVPVFNQSLPPPFASWTAMMPVSLSKSCVLCLLAVSFRRTESHHTFPYSCSSGHTASASRCVWRDGVCACPNGSYYAKTSSQCVSVNIGRTRRLTSMVRKGSGAQLGPCRLQLFQLIPQTVESGVLRVARVPWAKADFSLH
jgi:hypothetical protein